MMEVAVNSHYIIIRELFHQNNPNSRIVFTASTLALYPHATVLGYGVSKSGVVALTKGLMKEFDGTGTTINAVALGIVDTEWQKKKPQEIRNNICKKTALHKFATVDEVVDAYRFCIDNGFVNGSVIEINGRYSYK
jgi:3-oxoacyl-[acyl-carrier protein] reductase